MFDAIAHIISQLWSHLKHTIGISEAHQPLTLTYIHKIVSPSSWLVLFLSRSLTNSFLSKCIFVAFHLIKSSNKHLFLNRKHRHTHTHRNRLRACQWMVKRMHTRMLMFDVKERRRMYIMRFHSLFHVNYFINASSYLFVLFCFRSCFCAYRFSSSLRHIHTHQQQAHKCFFVLFIVLLYFALLAYLLCVCRDTRTQCVHLDVSTYFHNHFRAKHVGNGTMEFIWKYWVLVNITLTVCSFFLFVADGQLVFCVMCKSNVRKLSSNSFVHHPSS